jgi:hypothetical protein
MTDFVQQDLSGSRFEQVSLRDASFRMVRFDGASVRAASFHHVRMRGVELVDTTISGDVLNLVINGVDVGPLIDAELNRRHPERALLLLGTAEGYRQGWADLERSWAGTLERARALPEDWLHRSVDDEWSFIQTLRHLSFASAAWVGRMLLGNPSPWHPLDLPWDEAPGWDGIPWDREARPSLAQAAALWSERQEMVRDYLSTVTDEALAGTVSRSAPGWPQAEEFSVRECVHITVMETWEHRQFAERDLAVLEREQAGDG